MSDIRRVMRMLAATGIASAGLAMVPTSPAQAGPTHVAIVIAGDKTACVSWHSGITGDDVLNAVASVAYRPSDHLIVQIDGVPSSATADNTHFWAYWHNAGKGWVYSEEGASYFNPEPGTVEGWAYGDQAKPPLIPYSSICQDTSTPSPTPTPKPPASSTPRTQSASVPPGTVTTAQGPAAPPSGASSAPSPSRSRPPSSHAAAHRSTGAPARSSQPAHHTQQYGGAAGKPSTVDSTAMTAASRSTPAKKDSSSAPAIGTAIGLTAAAALGGLAFWRVRRQGGD